MKLYAGIGSRETPQQALDHIIRLAREMYIQGYTLRSGRAKGADTFFEIGHGRDRLELFTANDSISNPEWFEHASKYHPAWDRCSPFAKKLHARNSAILLGKNLDTPVDLVICWTEGGKLKGGTAQGLRIAIDLDIPIYNLGEKVMTRKEFLYWLDQVVQK